LLQVRLGVLAGARL